MALSLSLEPDAETGGTKLAIDTNDNNIAKHCSRCIPAIVPECRLVFVMVIVVSVAIIFFCLRKRSVGKLYHNSVSKTNIHFNLTDKAKYVAVIMSEHASCTTQRTSRLSFVGCSWPKIFLVSWMAGRHFGFGLRIYQYKIYGEFCTINPRRKTEESGMQNGLGNASRSFAFCLLLCVWFLLVRSARFSPLFVAGFCAHQSHS